MASAQKDYPAAFQNYRRREFAMFGSIIASFPGGLLVSLAFPPSFGGRTSAIIVPVLMIVVWLPCALRVTAWKCPRCGNPFHRDPAGIWQHARQCCTCDLPLYEPRPDS